MVQLAQLPAISPWLQLMPVKQHDLQIAYRELAAPTKLGLCLAKIGLAPKL